jgi:methionyl-tRNA synthetase
VLHPENRMTQVMAWLNESSLGDLSVSRPLSRQKWGILVPGDPNQTIYVWIDALVNYLTAMNGFKFSVEELSKVSMTHVIGKDILKFHSIYWPAILMALRLPLPDRIVAHAHWTVSHVKMSKSIGNVVDPIKLMEDYGVDAVRYYILRDCGTAEDGAYSEEILRMRYQMELADQLGNLLSRCLGNSVNPDQIFPDVHADQMTNDELVLTDRMNQLRHECDHHFDQAEYGKGLAGIMKSVHMVNQYLQKNEPWKLVKTGGPDGRRRSDTVIRHALESIKLVGILLQPTIPDSMDRLLSKLNVNDRSFNDAVICLDSKRKVETGKMVLFPRLAQQA